MKPSKIIGFFLIILQLGSAVAMILGMHTMLGVFSTAMPGGEQGIEIQFSDPVTIPFALTPRNKGYLEASMDVRVSMVVDGIEVASDSASVTVPPGSMVPIDLELSVPLADAEEYFQEGTDLELTTVFKVTTLYDLISFSNSMTIEGGMQ